jgi:hypothetical protein
MQEHAALDVDQQIRNLENQFGVKEVAAAITVLISRRDKLPLTSIRRAPGRPRKYISNAEKQRAYRTQREFRNTFRNTRSKRRVTRKRN